MTGGEGEGEEGEVENTRDRSVPDGSDKKVIKGAEAYLAKKEIRERKSRVGRVQQIWVF